MTTTPRPTWEQFWTTADNDRWLAAKRLLEVCGGPVRHNAEQWLYWETRNHPATPELDVHGWISDVDENGRGWSSTEGRIYNLVAALFEPGRTIDFVATLGSLGSWETEAWRILVEWGTGRRATVVKR